MQSIRKYAILNKNLFQKEADFLRIDCHNHSEFSMDAEYPVSRMLSAARDKKIKVFAVTDHCELNEWERDRLADTLPQSVKAIEAMKPSAALKLLLGVELGQPLQSIARAEKVLADYPFDMVIGSLHNNAGCPDFYFYDFASETDDEIFYLLKQYYSELLKMTEWGGFDTLAHITYPYRYLNAARRKREISVRPENFDFDADQVFKALIDRKKALEMNTSSLRRSEADLDLNIRYFKRYRDLGGELVTVGSDAHTPEQVGAGLEQAYQILADAGFQKIVYYEKREPVWVSLDE